MVWLQKQCAERYYAFLRRTREEDRSLSIDQEGHHRAGSVFASSFILSRPRLSPSIYPYAWDGWCTVSFRLLEDTSIKQPARYRSPARGDLRSSPQTARSSLSTIHCDLSIWAIPVLNCLHIHRPSSAVPREGVADLRPTLFFYILQARFIVCCALCCRNCLNCYDVCCRNCRNCYSSSFRCSLGVSFFHIYTVCLAMYNFDRI